MTGRGSRAVRFGSGLGVLGLAAGVVVGAAGLPQALQQPVPAVPVDVPAARTTLVCPGPLELPAGAGTGDRAFDPVPVPPVTRVDAVAVAAGGPGLGAGSLTALGAGQAAAGWAAGGGGAAVTLAGTAAPTTPTLLAADPVADQPPWVAGATSIVVTRGDLRGLAAAACQAAGNDLWLVGGSTEVSSSADLVLVNPGATVADVSVAVFGPTGAVDLSAGGRLLVAPGGRQVLALPGVAAEQRRLVVHVTSTGGSVAATVQDSRLSGFTAQGTSLVVPGTAPATRQFVPGIVVPDTAVDAPDAAALRLLAPAQATTARLTLLGPHGPVDLPGAEEAQLTAGQVVDVPLGGLPAGAYTAVVDADAAVVAAGVIARAGTPGELDRVAPVDRAWAASAAAVDGVAAVPAGLPATVVLTGADATGAGTDGPPRTATVRGVRADGGLTSARRVVVGRGATATLAVDDLGAGVVGVQVEAGGGVVWAVLLEAELADGTGVSVLAPTPPAERVGAVPVRTGDRVGLG